MSAIRLRLCGAEHDAIGNAIVDLSFTRKDAGFARVKIPLESMREILRVYGFFKNERNSSNHARLDADVITADDLKRKMLSGLQMIRRHVKEYEKNNGK